MKKVFVFFMIIFSLSSLYAIDLADVKNRLTICQEIKFINGVPLITEKQESKEAYSNIIKRYYIGFNISKSEEIKNTDNIKKDIKQVLSKYKPSLFESINVLSIMTTESTLKDIVSKIRKYAEIEYIQLETTKKSIVNDNSKDIFQIGIGEDILSYAPNDPLFNHQWYLYNPNGFDLKYLELQKYIKTHNIKRNFEDNEPVIALLDVGFYLDTDELKDRIWINDKEIPNNGKDDDGNGYIDDYRGVDVNPNHQQCTPNLSACIDNIDYGLGLPISSIIAAATNNGKYMAGILPDEVKILPISAEDTTWKGMVNYFLEGYDYILNLKERGVNIIAVNLTSQGGIYDRTEEALLSEMGKNGILVMAPAGNSNKSADSGSMQNYPAMLAGKLNNIVSVGVLDTNGHKAEFSNYGNINVNIYMPGTDIISLPYEKSNSITIMISSGASQAATIMSGVIGVVYWLYPNMNLIDLKSIILRNTKTVDNYNGYAIKTIDLISLTALK